MEAGSTGTPMLQEKVLKKLQQTGAALWTSLNELPSHVLTSDCRARLLKTVQAERHFLDRLAALEPTAITDSHLSSSNFGHLEGIVFVLQKQSWQVTGATAALQPFQIPSPSLALQELVRADDAKDEVSPASEDDPERTTAHVDLICTIRGEPVWVVVINSSAQNRLWFDKKGRKGLRTRLSSLLHAASGVSAAQPSSLVLLVRDGFDSSTEQQLQEDYQATRLSDNENASSSSDCSCQEVEDGEWVDIRIRTSWTSYWIKVTPSGQWCRKDCTENLAAEHVRPADCFSEENFEDEVCVIGSSPCWAAIKSLQARHGQFDQLQRERNLLNLDTTALVAIVSELTNGGAEHLLELSAEQRERRYPAMANFVYEQALVERDQIFLAAFEKMLVDKLPVICEYVHDEFTSIILTNGGPREKQRAQILLSQLKVVPNLPSSRVEALPETRRIKRRHKLVFGTGDFLQAPTLTANMSFVFAVQQQKVALAVIRHQPCALMGD